MNIKHIQKVALTFECETGKKPTNLFLPIEMQGELERALGISGCQVQVVFGMKIEFHTGNEICVGWTKKI